jgi:hypothetical protein
MIFGGIETEHLQINEDTVWAENFETETIPKAFAISRGSPAAV